MNMQQAIQTVLDSHDLTREEMIATMRLIMTGEATPAQIGGFLIMTIEMILHRTDVLQ